jgi:predicted dehydrogenase
MRKVKVGLTGLGNFGKLQCSILASLPNVDLIALCTRDAEKLKRIGERYGVPNLYTDHSEMVKLSDLDAVFIVSDERCHYLQAMQSIRAGKHTFVEKPIALTYEQGAEIAEAARKAGVYLQVGYILRFETRHAILKREIDTGRFGEVLYMTLKRTCSRRWFEDFAHRVHPVYETGTHDIDLALWLMNSRVKSVYAWDYRALGYENPECMVAMLRFENGKVATVETNWILPSGAPSTLIVDYALRGTLDSTLEVVGTHMFSRISLLSSDFVIWTDKGTVNPEVVLWPEVNGRVGGALRTELEHFIECVQQGRASDIVSVEDAVYGMKVADAIVESARKGMEVTLR